MSTMRKDGGGKSKGQLSSSSRPANSRPGTGGNSRGRAPRGGLSRAQRSERNRVWGKTPNAAFDQSSMTRLFESQKLLNAALRRQARLARLDVSEVRSAQAEQLRAVNEAILHASSSQLGVKNPFSDRNLTTAQLITEDMIRRSGKSKIEGASFVKPTGPTKFPIRKHRRDRTDTSDSLVVCPTLKDLLNLRGPLLRAFSRAKDRGYNGPPHRWLRGPQATRLRDGLVARGFDLAPVDAGMFHPRSPLRWAVTAQSSIKDKRRHGFRGERLRSEPTNFVVLRRQATSVPRLKLHQWPSHSLRGKLVHSWPTFPTLAESWEMVVRGKVPSDHESAFDSEKLRATKLPTKLVKPGTSARVIRHVVHGIRADVEVPRKFLAYFRYRWGFLILRRKSRLPNELVKFIAERWKSDISVMFLKCPIRFNDALRRMPSSTQWMLNGFVRGGVQRSAASTERSRKRPPKQARDLAKKARFHGHRIKDPTSVPSSSGTSDDGVRLY